MGNIFGNFYKCLKEWYVAVWILQVFRAPNKMSSGTSTCGGSASGGSGALSLMGCVREASPSPQDHHTFGMGEFSMQKNSDTLPKEPKKRRFHPLRGLRRIFRRKSRGAADGRINSKNGERDGDVGSRDREDITLGHPAGRAEETRSRSASELLTDSCDRQSKRRFEWPKKYRISLRKSINHVFLRHRTVEDSFAKLRVGSGQLSVSHDSVFPGEVPHTRPLSSLDTLATIERRQTKASDESMHKDRTGQGPYNNRISLRVLEQIKTAIESRNQVDTSSERYQQEITENIFSRRGKTDTSEDKLAKFKVTRVPEEVEEKTIQELKPELPELESASLSHNAAHHRISVRPKNRRLPKRTIPQANISFSTTTTISETSEAPDSLELFTPIGGSSPIDKKGPASSILRKSSSRISRNSDNSDEVETSLRKQASTASLSPDSLDSGIARTMLDTSELEESREIKPVTRKQSNRISKGSDIFDELESKLPNRRLSSNSRLSKSPDSLENSFSKSSEFGFDNDKLNKSPVRVLQTSMSISTEGFDTLSESVEIKSLPRKLSNTVSKSTEGFDKFIERDEPRPVARKLLLPISKSSDIVSKSSNSIETHDNLKANDSIERRRLSFEIRPKRGRQAISMSSENFEALNEGPSLYIQKRSSASDVNLSRGKRYSKLISKSIDSLEIVDTINKHDNSSCMDLDKNNWRSSSKCIVSSESSDNIELDDKLDNRRVLRAPKRVPSSSITDIYPNDNYHDNEKKPIPMRKPSRLQKKSESSDLGSTDTLNSEKRNKSFDSTETFDSLEKDLEQDKRDNNIIDEENNIEKVDKHDSWSKPVVDSETPNADGNENKKNQDKPYWRQNSETKENIDIHQLLEITSIVNHISDNGNNQRNNGVPFSTKKLTSPPTSPVVKQDDNKNLFNSLLVNKNDEDLQNMLNGNISEVSTTTKSFKEKLIMFERLGK